jgi:hypothetical protein
MAASTYGAAPVSAGLTGTAADGIINATRAPGAPLAPSPVMARSVTARADAPERPRRIDVVRHAYSAATAIALWAATLSGWAADKPSPDEPAEEIIIYGERQEVFRAFVDSVAEAGRTGQYGRWLDWVCPSVRGIEAAQAAWMEDRIAEIAESVALRRQDSCRPSLFVIITPDAGGFAQELARAAPITLRTDGWWKLNRFLKSEAPIRWLGVTDPCPRGCPLPNSRLVQATTPAFTMLLVVVDADKVKEFSLAELADYVALAALTNPNPDSNAPAESVLSMFDHARAPGTQYALTDRDRAFLAGLYESSADHSGRFQRNAIVRSMAKASASDPGAAQREP